MLKSSSRFPVKRLFVLGAGASYGACLKGEVSSSPLDKDFCSIIERLKVQRPSWVKSTRNSILKRWKDHRRFSDFGLEASVICQLGHLEFINSIHKRRRNEYSSEMFLNEITHLISYILDKADLNKSTNHYGRLVNLLTNNSDEISYDMFKDRIITFNYDTLLDDKLLEKFSPQQLYFDKISLVKTRIATRRKDRYRSPLILKMHGSNNWLCDQSEFEQMLKGSVDGRPYYLKNVWLKEKGVMLKPSDSFAPTIIPPLPNKPLTKIELFQYLWIKAAEYLSKAEELIICGYSLPGTDSLASSLFGNFENKKLLSITVIDPSPEVLMKWKRLLQRQDVQTRSWNYFSDLDEYLTQKGF